MTTLERPGIAQLLRYFLYLGASGSGARWPWWATCGAIW
jgi:hypothetical protein